MNNHEPPMKMRSEHRLLFFNDLAERKSGRTQLPAVGAVALAVGRALRITTQRPPQNRARNLRHLRHSVTTPLTSTSWRRRRRSRFASRAAIASRLVRAGRRAHAPTFLRPQPPTCACPILLDAARSPAMTHRRCPPTLAGFFVTSRRRSREWPDFSKPTPGGWTVADSRSPRSLSAGLRRFRSPVSGSVQRDDLVVHGGCRRRSG